MNVSRFCGVLGAVDDINTHQRFTEDLAPLIDRYKGRPFTPQAEWTAEQAILALHQTMRRFAASSTITLTMEGDELEENYDVLLASAEVEDVIRQFLEWAAEEV